MSKINSTETKKSEFAITKTDIVVWIFTDGKAGHEKQSLGLLDALKDYFSVDVSIWSAVGWGSNVMRWLWRRFPQCKGMPTPDLILAAGHGTHMSALVARRVRGGKLIVLMKPTLPLGWFDLCFVPEHDGVGIRSNVIPTRGALNQMQRSRFSHKDRGLIMIGGPSNQFNWDDESICKQVTIIAKTSSTTRWTLTTSRRTPLCFIRLLQKEAIDNLEVIPHEKTNSSWVGEHLHESSIAWISEDSVSMTYEALTSGCHVGLLESTLRGGAGRVAKGIDVLRCDGWVTRFSDWRAGEPLGRAPVDFNEARRCAEVIKELFL